MRDLNRVYIYNEALSDGEYNSEFFTWYDVDAPATIVFSRGKYEGKRCLVCLNFTDVPIENSTFEIEGEYDWSLL